MSLDQAGRALSNGAGMLASGIWECGHDGSSPSTGPHVEGLQRAEARGLTRELLLEDGGEGGEQVLQQLRQAALEQPWGTAVRLRLHHHLAGVL